MFVAENMKKAFTITELLVAVGLLAVVLAASGIIFNYSIDAMRTTGATAEIMRNLRAITDQLDADFAGLQKDAPLVIRFDSSNGLRADSIVFFATGDFQDASGVVRGNVARIYYGQALDPNLLARKQVILASSNPIPTNEYDANSLIKEVKEYIGSPGGVSGGWLSRPQVDDGNNIPMYLAKGVDNFSIKYCSSTDIDPNGTKWQPLSPIDGVPSYFGYGTSYPDLIKFNFTLYDSKGILKTGRRFEYIVYIGK